MVHRSLWFVGAITLVLGGCIIGYPLDKYDTNGTASSGAGLAGTGGEGGASISASSSSGGGNGGGGGAGGEGGMMCTMPLPLPIICDEREKNCLSNCYRLNWTSRAGSNYTAFAHGVAVDKAGNVAIVGEYNDAGVTFAGAANDPLPDSNAPGTAPFTEGFIIYHQNDGARTWAGSIGVPVINTLAMPVPLAKTKRIARSAAFDSNNDLIVVGLETNGIAKPSKQLFIRKHNTGSSSDFTQFWHTNTLASEDAVTEALAVSTFESNFYVLGRSTNAAMPVTCGANSNVTLTAGFFVAKFNASNACVWIRSVNNSAIDSTWPIAITARNADKNGVWITGRTGSTIDLTPLTPMMPGAMKTFVISLSNEDGTPIAGAFLPDDAFVPTSIATSDLMTPGVGTVFMSGSAVGPASVSGNAIEKDHHVGFLLKLEIRGPAAMVDAGGATVTGTKVFTGNAVTKLARLTGLVNMNNRLYVAGTFDKRLILDINNESRVISENGTVPFLATFDASGTQLLGFDSFATSLDTEAFSLGGLTVAGSSGKLALAGGWVNALDLTTLDGKVDGLRGRIGGSGTSQQIFVGSFDAP